MQSNRQNGDGLFLGRQPILDRSQATIGYEFLFRVLPANTTQS